MANPKHVKIFKSGREMWNQWRLADLRYPPDLTGMDLRKAELQWYDLRGVNLTGAILREADLSDALLEGVILKNADLTGAELTRSHIGAVYITKTDISYADFSSTIFGGTGVSEVDLSKTKGLDSVRHWIPSAIDARTLEETAKGLSSYPQHRNEIEKFYRGTGVSEHLIEYYRSRIGRRIEFYTCFISYSQADRAFARLLYTKLQEKGIRCWLDEHNILPGDNIHDAVKQGIRYSDKVLLCCSENSLNSWWVDAEIEIAFTKERQLFQESKQLSLVLIPLDLDGYLLSGNWNNGKATQVRSRLAGNFNGWKSINNLSSSEFARLVKALSTQRSSL